MSVCGTFERSDYLKKAERLNQELIYLKDKHRFQLKDLMKEFEISKRTALRDLQTLEEMGLPYYVHPGRFGGYELINHTLLTPIYFNLNEIQAVFFALNAMADLSSNPFEYSFAQIKTKLLATLPQTQQKKIEKLSHFVYFYATAPINQGHNLAMILTAILNEEVLSGIDTQHDGQSVQLQIFELFYRDGIWFCSAQNYLTQTWGTFRTDKLINLSVVSSVAPLYTLSQLADLQKNYEKNYHNISFRCQINQAGKQHFLRNHYPNLKLEEKDAHIYLVGGYNQSELEYMTNYLIGFGNNLKIESPVQLQTAYLDTLKKMFNQY